jgi:5-methylcytosine-specific restriction endonuclease McrA
METAGHYLRRCIKAKEKAAAKAIAAGRIPGRVGQPPKYTEVQRKELRRIKSAKWRDANRERAREINRVAMKKASDAKAIAAGHEPGVVGRRAKPITLEQKRAKQNARVKKYYANNLEVAREIGARAARKRRAILKGCTGTHTAADIRELFFEQKGLCGLCDLALDVDNYHVDHWKPLSKGGSNDKSNLKLLHPKCNLSKGAKLPSEFNVRSA